MEDFLTKEIVYRIKSLDQVDKKNNLVYKTTESESLLMDVYMPKGILNGEKLPVVIFIHGESPYSNMKETGQYISLGKLVAASGFAAVTFNHRMLLHKFNVEEINKDIESLIAYIQKHADSLNIDEHRIAIWSASAGVPFGLCTAIHNETGAIKCVVSYYGFGDLESLDKILNFNIPNQDKKIFSPIDLINGRNSNNVVPMFIARAGLDSPIINESMDKFIIQALLNNLNIDIYNHPSGEHAFDLLNDNIRTHEIIQKTIEFLKLYLYT